MKKNILPLCLAFAAITLFYACKKDDQPQPGSPATSFGFFKENFTFKTREYVRPNDTSAIESIQHYTFVKNAVGGLDLVERSYLVGDTVPSDGDQFPVRVSNNLFALDSFALMNVLNPTLNTTYTEGDMKITLIQDNVPVSTNMGTFNCYKFRSINAFGDTMVVLTDKDYKYPFIKTGDLYHGNEMYWFEITR